ncbi:carbohydrate ABC transporter permease [Bifidobacterium sp.]|uniref:carbohydrate ABC transporter permease n=1 Tax=Bifidobacterium sp. TaxID=41200 RepID=UPI0039EB4CB5
MTSVGIKTRDAIRRPRKHRSGGEWAILALLIVGGLIMLFPLLVILLNAFKSATDYATNGPLGLPREFSLKGIQTFWNATEFPWRIWTSVWTSGLVAAFAVVLSSLSAYALGIGRVKGRSWIVLLIMLANMMPQEALLYPLYMMFKSIGLYDSDWAIVIIFTVLQSAFGTYLLSSVYGTFPKAILEAATIDGASRWQIFHKVVLPVSRPTLSVLLVFFFVWTWNEYMIPNAFLISSRTQTVPIALSTLSGQNMMDATTTAGASLISIVPTLIFFLIFQKTLARGITVGSVK